MHPTRLEYIFFSKCMGDIMTQGIFMRSTFKGCLVICTLLPHRGEFKTFLGIRTRIVLGFGQSNRLKQLQFTLYDLSLHPICLLVHLFMLGNAYSCVCLLSLFVAVGICVLINACLHFCGCLLVHVYVHVSSC